jgi:hypothetical protein
MPSHTCSICKKWDVLPSRIAFLHKCQVCFRPFCKQCAATYFLCKNCAADLPAGVENNLVAAMEKPKKAMDSTMVGTGIGAILLPTTLLVVFIITTTHAFFLFFLPILQAVSGIVLLIVSAAMRYTSRMAMVLRDYKKGFPPQASMYNPVPGWQPQAQPYQAYQQDVQPIVPPARSPAIPSSAFMPEVNEVPYQAPSTAKKGRNVPSSFDVTPTIATPKDSKFCGSCGAALPDIHDLRFCPGCGAAIE